MKTRCRFHGCISRATLWRGITTGRYSRPIKASPHFNRWLLEEAKRDRAALIAARERACSMSGPTHNDGLAACVRTIALADRAVRLDVFENQTRHAMTFVRGL